MTCCLGAGRSLREVRGSDGLQRGVSWQHKMCCYHRKGKQGLFSYSPASQNRFKFGKVTRTFRILLYSLPVHWILVSDYNGHHRIYLRPYCLSGPVWKQTYLIGCQAHVEPLLGVRHSCKYFMVINHLISTCCYEVVYYCSCFTDEETKEP